MAIIIFFIMLPVRQNYRYLGILGHPVCGHPLISKSQCQLLRTISRRNGLSVDGNDKKETARNGAKMEHGTFWRKIFTRFLLSRIMIISVSISWWDV
ncbi:hypothetical protein ACNKHM_15655 [Shigella sonnei]